MTFVRHPYRSEFTGPMQPCQAHSVATVRFYPLAGSSGNKRGSHNSAVVTKPDNLAVQIVSGRTGFVAKVESASSSFCQLHNHRRHRARVRPNVAQKPNLSATLAISNSHRNLQFRCIKTDENLAISHH